MFTMEVKKMQRFQGVETQMDETFLLCDVPGGRRPKSAVDFDEGCAKKLSTTYNFTQLAGECPIH